MKNVFLTIIMGHLFAPLAGLAQEQQESLIFNKILDIYANCNFYIDEIEATHKIFHGNFRTTQENIKVKTAFVRLDSFRLEIIWENPDRPISHFQKRAIIYKMGKVKAIRWMQFGTQTPTLDSSTLGLAISGIVGISYGVGNFITYLLMPDSLNVNFSIFDQGNWDRLGEEYINGELCFKFKQVYEIHKDPQLLQKLEEANDPVLKKAIEKQTRKEAVYWFRQKDLLLVKCHQKNQSPTYSSEMVWTVKPIINQPVSPEMLQPNLPK